jgi:hypothetical protein
VALCFSALLLGAARSLDRSAEPPREEALTRREEVTVG